MTPQEWAAKLNGREYRYEVDQTECQIAKMDGIVIVFGASDDLIEFRGAINDEIGAYGSGTAYLTPSGLLENDCDEDNCPYFAKAKKAAATIKAKWDDGTGYAWTYETAIPHATFDIIESDGELRSKYCRGIVFKLSDVPQ